MARAPDQLGGEAVELDQDRAHASNGIDAVLGPRPVRGAAADDDLVPGEALVRDRDGYLGAGGLGDDRGVGPHRLGDGLGADRGELLVADGGNDDVARNVLVGGVGGSHHDGGQAGLHVVRAAAVEAVSLDPRRGVGHSVDANDIHVSVQEQRAAAALPPRPGDDVGPARLDVGNVDLEAALGQPAADEPGDLAFPRAARDEAGVDRVDGDEVGQ